MIYSFEESTESGEYAVRVCWADSTRQLCKRNKDGSIDFAKDITVDELKSLVGSFMRISEVYRQKLLRSNTNGLSKPIT